MDEIRYQVAIARRRLILQQFVANLPWALFAALLVATLAVAAPKVFVMQVNEQYWVAGWFGGALLVGLLAAVIWTYATRRGYLEAALEIDRRFGLKERVSSALTLAPAERESEVGQALINDASRRVVRVDVGEQFRVSTSWRAALPLLPAIALLLIAFLAPSMTPQKSSASDQQLATKEQIKKANDQLKKKVEDKIKRAEDQGLKDAEAILKELKAQVENLQSKDGASKKEALIKLNDLKDDLEKRREKLGGAEKMKKQLEKLENVEKGPADKLAAAMKEGDFKQAMQALDKLREKLESGDMTADEKQEMANQLEQMRDKLQQMKDAQEQAKAELKKQIEQAKAAGDKEKAQQLQAQLDQLSMQDESMQQAQQMCDKLGECANALKNGDANAAADQLGKMAQQLQQMQKELEEMETLDEVLDEIADAKDAMNCKECNGEGCSACQGNKMGQFGMGQGMGQQGNGLGQGRGQGDRPEAETDTGEFLSRVGADPQAGESVRTGEAGGANASGRTKEGVKEEILSSLRADSDPLSNQALPKSEARHAKEYFEKLRGDAQ